MNRELSDAEKQFLEQLEAYKELRVVWRDDPERYMYERLGMRLTHHQRQGVAAIQPEGSKVSIRSGHGTGKTGLFAGVTCWFLECEDYCRIPCTAPTSAQLKDVLWAEIAKRVRAANDESEARGDHPRLRLHNLFRLTNSRFYDYSAPKEWFAVARTSGPANPDALQGFHASNLKISEDGKSLLQTEMEEEAARGKLLFLIDESSGVIDKVFEVAEGALSSPGSRLLMAGNPTKTSGYFFDSHNKNRGSFTTLHFKTQDSPLAAPDYREKLVRKFGENSNVVRVRADGEFPKQEDDVLIALELVEPILFREPVQFVSGTKRRLGIDVARYGDDRTTFVLRAGPTIEHIHFHEKKDLMETVGRAAHLARAWHAHEICVDVNGMGGGVADRLRELGFTVIDVDVNVAAPGRPAGALFQADKMRDHLMLELLEWLEDPRASAYLAANESPEQKEMIEDMIGEIASVKYKLLSNGKLRIESKDEMKARGLRSPDFMEGLNMTLTPQRSGTGRISSAGKRVF